MLKGLTSACIGLLFASVGFSPIDAQARFTFIFMIIGIACVFSPILKAVFAKIKGKKA